MPSGSWGWSRTAWCKKLADMQPSNALLMLVEMMTMNRKKYEHADDDGHGDNAAGGDDDDKGDGD